VRASAQAGVEPSVAGHVCTVSAVPARVKALGMAAMRLSACVCDEEHPGSVHDITGWSHNQGRGVRPLGEARADHRAPTPPGIGAPAVWRTSRTTVPRLTHAPLAATVPLSTLATKTTESAPGRLR